MAKIVLTDAPAWFLTNPRTYFNLGIVYLAGVLRARGHDVQLVFSHEVTSWDAGRKRMVCHPERMPECDFLGVSSTTPQIRWAVEMARAWPARCKVLGGSHATYIMTGPYRQYKQPRYFDGFDYVMAGECEESFVQLVEAPDLDAANVPGCWYVGAQAMEPLSAAPLPPQPDVTQLPLPAFDLLAGRLPELVLRHDGGVGGRVSGFCMSTRGCPFDCTFCADARTTVRDHSLVQMDDQFAELQRLGVTAIRFNDDTFNVNRHRSRLLTELAHEHGIKWRATVRTTPTLCTPELFTHYREHGCSELQFGVEHASESVLRHMSKRIKPEDNERAIKLAQDCGLAAHAFLILGFPGETQNSIDEMRDWVLRVRPSSVAIHMFQPLPGSEVWNHPERFGVSIKEASLRFENMWELLDDAEMGLSIELPTITPRDLFARYRELTHLFRRINRDGSNTPSISEGESMRTA